MMDKFASAITENVRAKGLPTCLPLGNDFNLWASSLAVFPLGRHFLYFVILVRWWLFILLLDNKQNQNKIICKNQNTFFWPFCSVGFFNAFNHLPTHYLYFISFSSFTLNRKKEVQIPGQQVWAQSYVSSQGCCFPWLSVHRFLMVVEAYSLPWSQPNALNNGRKPIFATLPHVSLYLCLTTISKLNQFPDETN